jgi:hypothetical protein
LIIAALRIFSWILKITDPKHLSRKLRDGGPSTPRMELIEPGNPELGGYLINYLKSMINIFLEVFLYA